MRIKSILFSEFSDNLRMFVKNAHKITGLFMYSVNCYYPKNGVKLNDTNMIKNVYHIGIPDKSGFTIWDTEKQRYCWQDKAGGYGIQTPFGMKHIKKIDGDYYNVVGLPVSKLYQVLRNEFDFEM